MWLPWSTLGVPALLLAGAAAGIHCTAMCGALGTHHLRAAQGLPAAEALFWLHSGRVLGYGALGLAFGALGQSLLRHLPAPWIGAALQATADLALIGVGAQLLAVRKPAPACCHAPAPPKSAWIELPPWLNLFGRGLLWAAMPCGLLYSVLLLAALSGDAASGGLLAGAFALGGTPLLAAVAWRGARRAQPGSRLAGWWLIGLGVLGLAAILVLPHAGLPGWCAPAGRPR